MSGLTVKTLRGELMAHCDCEFMRRDVDMFEAAIEQAAVRRADEPRVASGLPTADDHRWYIEARIGSENHRGEDVRFIWDRPGSYRNEPAEAYIRSLLANLPVPRPPEPDRTAARCCVEAGCPHGFALMRDGGGLLAPSGPYIGTSLDALRVAEDRTAALVARVAALEAALGDAVEEAWCVATSGGTGGKWCLNHDTPMETETTCHWVGSLRDCLAATPEPAPVADGTVCDGCGHSWEQHAGALGCTFESDQPDWFCACGEMEPTPTPSTDGAA